MPSDLSNFEQVEYGDVPFTPYVAPKKRNSSLWGSYDDDTESVPNFFLRSITGGLVGAALGAVAFAAFVMMTGATIGYLAILVGFLVGKGMMIGSKNEGGEAYQFASVGLTYFSVASARGVVLLLADEHAGVVMNSDRVLKCIKTGLLWPMMQLISSPVHGLIGVAILFVGLRAAWRMTSDQPGPRHPFSR